MNYDMGGFYKKTIRDWAEAARPDGNFTDTAPFVGIQYCGVGWAMVHPLLLEQLYQHYGNRRLIEEELPAAIKWFNLEASKRENGLVMKGLGDHEALKRIAGPVITTPMFIATARRMARLCRLVDDGANAERFEKMAAESAEAWAKAFVNEQTGQVGEGSQTEQTLALTWGTLPEPVQEKVFGTLVKDLNREAGGPSLTTGIFGTRSLLEELSRRDRPDLAHGLATRRTFPSWGWMLENGATTLWEDWQGTDGVKSHNHPMFGSISAWFFRWLGGIQCGDDAVAFDRIAIRPQIVDGLDWVESSHQSIRGPIVSNWRTDGDLRVFDIMLPPDSRAIIELPRREGDQLTESGRPIDQAEGVSLVEADGVFRLEAGSGRYRFETAPKD
jgi:alpha-L-rhamnosidase